MQLRNNTVTFGRLVFIIIDYNGVRARNPPSGVGQSVLVSTESVTAVCLTLCPFGDLSRYIFTIFQDICT